MAKKTGTAAKKKPTPKKAARPEAASAALVKKRPITSKAKAQPLRAKGPETAASNERTAAPIPETTLIPHNRIRPSGLNPRKSVREGYIEELAESLKATGQLQNISVRSMGGSAPTSKAKAQAPAAEGGGTAPSYEIIYGEQRWQAFRLLIERGDLPADHPILCRVMWVDDAQHLELAILENQAREDVHPLEQAEAYARLAKIRAEETGDDKTATRMIAERTGQTMRNVQFYLQVAGNLSDEAKAAWRDGVIRNRKIAIELARWPHDIQNDAVSDSWDFEQFSDPAELRRFLERDAPPVTMARFDLEAYTAAGGVIVPGEEGGPDRLANKGLAGRLQREWAEAEAARITQEKGYGAAPSAAESGWNLDAPPWAKPVKGTPKSAMCVRYHVDPYDLKVAIKHPLCHAKMAQAAAIQAALGDRDGETPLEDLPQPYSRRNWMAGAAARSELVRKRIASEERPHAALAVALMALLPKEGYFDALCGLRVENHTGDAGEINRNLKPLPFGALEVLRELPGFTKDGKIKGSGLAMQSLMGLPHEVLGNVFSRFIASLCIDASCTIGPGAKAETRLILESAEDDLGGLCTAEWLKAYTAPQIMALAEESGAAHAMRAAGKPVAANKSFLVSEVPGYIPPDYIPPEARILSREEAEQAVASMLARKPGRPEEGAAA